MHRTLYCYHGYWWCVVSFIALFLNQRLYLERNRFFRMRRLFVLIIFEIGLEISSTMKTLLTSASLRNNNCRQFLWIHKCLFYPYKKKKHSNSNILRQLGFIAFRFFVDNIVWKEKAVLDFFWGFGPKGRKLVTVYTQFFVQDCNHNSRVSTKTTFSLFFDKNLSRWWTL